MSRWYYSNKRKKWIRLRKGKGPPATYIFSSPDARPPGEWGIGYPSPKPRRKKARSQYMKALDRAIAYRKKRSKRKKETGLHF